MPLSSRASILVSVSAVWGNMPTFIQCTRQCMAPRARACLSAWARASLLICQASDLSALVCVGVPKVTIASCVCVCVRFLHLHVAACVCLCDWRICCELQ